MRKEDDTMLTTQNELWIKSETFIKTSELKDYLSTCVPPISNWESQISLRKLKSVKQNEDEFIFDMES